MAREGSPIEIRQTPGDVVVELPETPSSGYLWSLNRAPAGVEEVSQEYREGGPQPIAGGTGLRSFHLFVPAPGVYRLEFVLRRPWEAEGLERRLVSLVVSA
jgi:inhibitor of cysteine peptidase